ncbi:MAG: hypothetical protein ACJZ8O_10175, partial [Pirellulaceae bacterium]
MTGHDCPYKQWLGVESPNPSFYDLFEIGNNEQDLQVIKEAADRALSIVRGFKPGAQAQQWATLLDELELALKTLSDSNLRSAYDQQLVRGEAVAALKLESSDSPDTPQQQSPEQAEVTPTTTSTDEAGPGDISSSLDMAPAGATELDPMAPLDLTPNGVSGDPMAPVDVKEITSVSPQAEVATTAPVQSTSPTLMVEEQTTTSAAAAYHAKSKSRTKGLWIATGVLGVAIAGIIITLQVLPDSISDTDTVAQNQSDPSESNNVKPDENNQESQNPSNDTGNGGEANGPDEPKEEPVDKPEPEPEPEPEP